MNLEAAPSPEEAYEFAAAFVVERFADARPQSSTGGWSALCPLCDTETRIEIARDLTFDDCANGHTRTQIIDATSPPAEVEPSKWGFRCAADFLAEVYPPQRWLYLDLVPAESVTVVMAAPNAGKTFFAIDVVVQVAVRAAEQGVEVRIVEEEGTATALQWRLSRALASVGADRSHEIAQRIHITWNTGRSILDVEQLAALAQECRGAELIMLDSLSVLSGGIDENSSEDMARVAAALHSLKVNTNAALLVLHHMTKAAWKEGETPRLEHMRGHGALPGRADAVLALVPLESDKDNVRFELHCVKQRDGGKPKARVFSVAMTGPAAEVTISDKDEAPVTSASKTAAVEADTYSKIPEEPNSVSKKFLEHVVRGHRGQDVRRAVDRLVDSGRIVVTATGKFCRVSGGTTQGSKKGRPGRPQNRDEVNDDS